MPMVRQGLLADVKNHADNVQHIQNIVCMLTFAD